MSISNTPTGSHSRQSMALFAVVYGQCCADKSTDQAKDDACAIINNGRMLSSLILGYSQCQRPINWRANPDEETTDWRARRGRTAQRVRREEMAIAVSYPYLTRGSADACDLLVEEILDFAVGCRVVLRAVLR